MGVFENIYTSKYIETEKINRMNAIYEDFNFFDSCMTSVIRTFTWSNLPDETLPNFMPEIFLNYSGRLAFGEKNGKFYTFPAFPSGKLLENGEFDEYLILKPDGTEFKEKSTDIEIIFNNCFKIPYIFKVKQFSDKMSKSIRAVDSALDRVIMPDLIATDDDSIIKALGDYQNDFEKKLKTFIVGKRSKFNDKSFETTSLFDNTKTDVLALWDVFIRYRNLFYTTFGFNNVEIQKRERLTEAEGSGNDEIVRYTILQDMNDCRKDGIERVKKHFNYNLGFELNRDIRTIYEIMNDNETKLHDSLLEISKGTGYVDQPEQADEDSEKGGE